MTVLKLSRRYLNLEHVAVIEVDGEDVEVVTPYEVLRLRGADAERVKRAAERLAALTERRLEALAGEGRAS